MENVPARVDIVLYSMNQDVNETVAHNVCQDNHCTTVNAYVQEDLPRSPTVPDVNRLHRNVLELRFVSEMANAFAHKDKKRSTIILDVKSQYKVAHTMDNTEISLVNAYAKQAMFSAAPDVYSINHKLVHSHNRPEAPTANANAHKDPLWSTTEMAAKRMYQDAATHS